MVAESTNTPEPLQEGDATVGVSAPAHSNRNLGTRLGCLGKVDYVDRYRPQRKFKELQAW